MDGLARDREDAARRARRTPGSSRSRPAAWRRSPGRPSAGSESSPAPEQIGRARRAHGPSPEPSRATSWPRGNAPRTCAQSRSIARAAASSASARDWAPVRAWRAVVIRSQRSQSTRPTATNRLSQLFERSQVFDRRHEPNGRFVASVLELLEDEIECPGFSAIPAGRILDRRGALRTVRPESARREFPCPRPRRREQTREPDHDTRRHADTKHPSQRNSNQPLHRGSRSRSRCGRRHAHTAKKPDNPRISGLNSLRQQGAARISNRGWRFCRPLPYHLATAPRPEPSGSTICSITNFIRRHARDHGI